MAAVLRAGIVIVSDTASQNPSADKCEATLREAFAAAETETTRWVVDNVTIVPDNALDIQRAVIQWTESNDSHMNLVVTSGGTGFTQRDITPEAISSLIHKHAPGLVHAMLSTSFSITPFAAMARPVAGVRNKTLLLTLPGSPKGAKENLESVIRLLPHACQQAAGVDSRSLHSGGTAKLERDAAVAAPSTGHSHSHDHGHGHGHHHGHSHHRPRPETAVDSSSNPTMRQRSSPWPMVSVKEALDLIGTHVPAPESVTLPLAPSLLPCVLSSAVHAKDSVPAFPASIVDGYAIHIPHDQATNKAGIYAVSQVSHAQPTSNTSGMQPLDPNTIARITTGAPLPPSANAVCMVEDTRLASTTPSGTEEATVEILTSSLVPGTNIRAPGSDVQAGSLLLPSHATLSPLGGEFALLASAGVTQVPVFRRPTIGVLSTGDELVAHSTPTLAHGQVRDTNRPSLLAAVTHAGFPDALDLGVAPDRPDELEASLRSAFGRCDVLVTTGGVSMGEKDLLKSTVRDRLGGRIHFGRVSMKPGKPTTFATVEDLKPALAGSGGGGDRAGVKKVFFGLPGNPASALVTFHLFVLPALQRIMGHDRDRVGLPEVRARLLEACAADASRQEYVRAVVGWREQSHDGGGDGGGVGGGLVARTTGGQRSSRVGSFGGANALLRMPLRDRVGAGEEVTALMMGPLAVGI